MRCQAATIGVKREAGGATVVTGGVRPAFG